MVPKITRPSVKSRVSRSPVSTAESGRLPITLRATCVALSAISSPWPSAPSSALSGTKARSRRSPPRSRARSPCSFSLGSSSTVPAASRHLSTMKMEYAPGPLRLPVRAYTSIVSATVALPISHFSPVSS